MAMKIAKIDVEWDTNIQYCKYDLMDLGFIMEYYKAQKPADQRSFWIFFGLFARKLIKMTDFLHTCAESMMTNSLSVQDWALKPGCLPQNKSSELVLSIISLKFTKILHEYA